LVSLERKSYKVVAQSRDLERLKPFLWRGDVAAKTLFTPLPGKKQTIFVLI